MDEKPSQVEIETGLRPRYWSAIYGDGDIESLTFYDGDVAASWMMKWGRGLEDMDSVLGDIPRGSEFYRGFKRIVDGLYSGELVSVPMGVNTFTGCRAYMPMERWKAEEDKREREESKEDREAREREENMGAIYRAMGINLE